MKSNTDKMICIFRISVYILRISGIPPCKIGIYRLDCYYGKVRIVFGFLHFSLRITEKEVRR